LGGSFCHEFLPGIAAAVWLHQIRHTYYGKSGDTDPDCTYFTRRPRWADPAAAAAVVVGVDVDVGILRVARARS
jgi:hypothetical protein